MRVVVFCIEVNFAESCRMVGNIIPHFSRISKAFKIDFNIKLHKNLAVRALKANINRPTTQEFFRKPPQLRSGTKWSGVIAAG